MPRRPRAVRLSAPGHQALMRQLAACFEQYAETHGRARQTREINAELLGVSIRTADRILRREPVDRTSLLVAFRTTGLEIQDEFVEHPFSGAPANLEPASNGLQENHADRPAAPAGAGTTQRPAWAWWFPALAAMLLVGAIGLLLVSWPQPRAVDEVTAWQVEVRSQLTDATTAYQRGDYAEAWRLVRIGGRSARKNYHASAVAWSLRLEGQLLAAEGRDLEALEKYRLASDSLKDLGMKGYFYPGLELSGNAYLQLRRYEEAEKDFLGLLAWSRDQKQVGLIVSACRGLGTVAHETGDYKKAIAWFDQGLESLAQGEEVDMAVDLRARRAVTLTHLGRGTEALKTMRECLGHWQAKRHARWIATTHYQTALVHRAIGNPGQAADLLKQAQKLYLSVGDNGGVARCRELQAKLE